MKHLALDEIQIAPSTGLAPASSSELFAFIAREGGKLQVNTRICAAYLTPRGNGVEDSHSTPSAGSAGAMSSPTRFDTVVHYGIVASTVAALIAGAANDWSAVVMALILVPFGVIMLRLNGPSTR